MYRTVQHHLANSVIIRKTFTGFGTGPRCHGTSGWYRTITTVRSLDSWNIRTLREQAFIPELPAVLPSTDSVVPDAVNKWFTYRQNAGGNNDQQVNRSGIPQLNESFWSKYSDLIVPLEVTHLTVGGTVETDFDRIQAPMSLLLADLRTPKENAAHKHSIYLAQHDLRDLPQALQDDLPTPALVKNAGNGDLYSSSLWLGRSPTYTPLHRDPNPNLLVQLAGIKIIRLFHPEIGNAVFDYAQQLVHQSRGAERSSLTSSTVSATFRGDEMMRGTERRILHDIVWTEMSNSVYSETILSHAQSATLHSGQALFIPKGWWHSVKGVGEGITASANWWFR